MDVPYRKPHKNESFDQSLEIIKYFPYPYCTKFPSPWLDLRVFYVRISNFHANSSTPEFLILNHIPLSPDTLLEVNGIRHKFYSEEVSSVLRRNRVDKKSEEATFVSTDSVRFNGSVKFEVFDKEDMILSGFLEISNGNGLIGESKSNVKHWSMKCESKISVGFGFLTGKHIAASKLPRPTFEVCVAGCFLGSPIIMTKTLQTGFHKKSNRKATLDSIPENDTAQVDLKVTEGRNRKMGSGEESQNMYLRMEYKDGEDDDLSWFNAGVSVGVGIGLSICVGVGIGVGLLARSYQATTRNFTRRLV